MTDPARHECGIYLITGDHRNVPTPRVASTFREFVLDYALGGGFERRLYGQQDQTGDWNKPGPIGFGQASIETDED